MKKNVYLDNKELDETLDIYFALIKNKFKVPVIDIATKDSFNYKSATAAYAKVSSPNYNASAMDGIALNYEICQNASINEPCFLKEEDYQKVDTGDVINHPYNAVIMIEDVVEEKGLVKLIKPASYFQHIRVIGEDITQTQMIIPSNHYIKAVDLGPLMASQNEFIKVYDKLKIGIIPTGSEIVDVSTKNLQPGMIIDANSSMIKGLVLEMNHIPKVYDVVKDDYQLLKKNFIKASLENDIVLINAGSSAGSEDYTVHLIRELGEVAVHGISIKPGKPAILGIINNTLFIGLPGYPVSSYIVFQEVVAKIINRLYNEEDEQKYVKAILTKSIHSSLKHKEFVRVKLGYMNNEYKASPLARGAGISMSLLEADGIIEIPQNSEGYAKNTEVLVKLYHDETKIKASTLALGSHDLIVDLLNESMNVLHFNSHINSSHVGSYNGLLALLNNECKLAFSHILGSDAMYNIEIIKQLFKENMIIIKGVKRRQGLLTLKDNPLKIKDVSSLSNPNLKYVNRQQGSGTSILLNHLLKEANINSSSIKGYDFIMPTHFNVAAAIKNKTADTGIAIYSVAKALDLNFIEVAQEDYDLIIYEKDLYDEDIQNIIKTLKSTSFHEKVTELEGYDLSESGQIIYVKKEQL